MEQDNDSKADARYEQQWQAHLAYEIKARQTLEQQQQQEKIQLYLNEINSGERNLLATRHQAECRAQAQQHRAMRIAIRKGCQP